FCTNLLPFPAVESRAGLDSDDLRASVGERNPTFLARERQGKHIKITVILTRATNPLLKKQPQVCLVEIGPRVGKKTLRHWHHSPIAHRPVSVIRTRAISLMLIPSASFSRTLPSPPRAGCSRASALGAWWSVSRLQNRGHRWLRQARRSIKCHTCEV